MDYDKISITADHWIKQTTTAALESVKTGGGPFAAIVVQIDNNSKQVIRHWLGCNRVTLDHDPSAHAEIIAIRTACTALNVFNLAKLSDPTDSHCVLYSSCEPCPMCLSAAYWAGIRKLVFAATRFDAAAPGVDFCDALIYQELEKPYDQRQHMTVCHAKTPDTLNAFDYYKNNAQVIRYGEIPKS